MSPAARPDRLLPSYSTAEVARMFGVSIPTVQRWVDQGVLKAWKTVGGHRRIDAESAGRFLHSQRSAPVGVLIVDDNPDDRDLLGAIVEAALPGAAITVAANGFDGLVALGQRAPDVLITDILMPHMNGVQMLRHLSAEALVRPRVIVAVSSRTPEQFASMGALPPEVHFVRKPVQAEPLKALLRDAFGAVQPAV